MNSHVAKEEARCPFHQLHHAAKTFDFFDQAYQKDPATALSDFREQLPIFYSEKMGYWVVTRYEDVKAIFRDPIVFSACNVLEKLTPNSAEAEAILKKYHYAMNRTLVNEDEPIHMQRRRALLEAFAPEQLQDLKRFVDTLVNTKIDQFIANGQADLVAELFWDVPLMVALKFLGIPEEDMQELKKFAVAHTVNTWGRPSIDEQCEVAEGVGRFWQYAGQVLAKMKQQPDGSGWMYDMIAQNKAMPDVVTDNYLHSMMMAILVAAHETTSLAAANTVKVLLEQPDLWQTLCKKPELIPQAVEECLRYAGSVVSWRRQVTQDIHFNGVDFKAGDKIFLVSAAANQDPRHFNAPDEIDLYRDNSAEHLTFGYGAHQCLGRNIGRMEICILVEALTRRLPTLQLCPQEFHYLPNTSFRGPQALWVKWQVTAPTRPALEFPLGPPDTQHLYRKVQVHAIQDIHPHCKAIYLKACDGMKLPTWQSGAHIELRLPNGLLRKYSLCPSDHDVYRIVVQHEVDGRGGSAWIHQSLEQGDILELKGPKNFFHLNHQAKQHVLLAAGIGITPILAMANELKQAGRDYRLIYIGRQADLPLLDEVLHEHPHAEIYISSEQRLDLEKFYATLKPQTQLCACGPTRLLDALQQLAAEYPHVNLTLEHFNAAPNHHPDDQAFEVELIDSKKYIQVAPHQTLLDCLIEHGIEVSYDCKEGLCGSCQVDVVEGHIVHRDKVLTPNERQSMQRMMSCCSRGQGKISIKL